MAKKKMTIEEIIRHDAMASAQAFANKGMDVTLHQDGEVIQVAPTLDPRIVEFNEECQDGVYEIREIKFWKKGATEPQTIYLIADTMDFEFAEAYDSVDAVIEAANDLMDDWE